MTLKCESLGTEQSVSPLHSSRCTTRSCSLNFFQCKNDCANY
ncbi:hypothetical protein AB205_0209380 [Aquarana catesbeiana]|uniref:Uncharacterized protein n=1 Tax=Aquarana catesbeiana TaxID=8400 RepID=A0A2G9RTP7_AQUCT|nr:hypothetical protein AB205_0209380 [Aquarana catesbeiana]